MKTLLLVRHAKSDWGTPSLGDIDRPLNDRGKRDAPVMAQRLLDKKNKNRRLHFQSCQKSEKNCYSIC